MVVRSSDLGRSVRLGLDFPLLGVMFVTSLMSTTTTSKTLNPRLANVPGRRSSRLAVAVAQWGAERLLSFRIGSVGGLYAATYQYLLVIHAALVIHVERAARRHVPLTESA